VGQPTGTRVQPPTVSLTIYINLYIVVRVTNSEEPDAESFLPLKPNWFHVMISLADKEQHGYGIMQEVLERTKGKIRLWPATLYGTLERLLEEGLITEASRRPPADEDDARRRYYRLTTLGRRVLAAESIRLEDLVRVIRAKRRAAGSEA
jgi:DNA-binding PadR family transcriptional regulator